MKKFKRMTLLVTVGLVAVVWIFSLKVVNSNVYDPRNQDDSWMDEVGLSPEVISLEQLNVDTERITLSGFSAGASMAIQTHLSHSKLFSGLAIFSQTFYHCGHRSLIEFGIRCSTTGLGLFPYSVASSIEDAQEYEKKGLIDPLSNLVSQRFFIWTGQLDIYIPPDMAKKNVEFYKGVGVNLDNLRFTLFKNATHLIPTEDYGPACDKDAGKSYYLGDCDYPGAFHALSYILNNSSMVQAKPDLQQLRLYNQSEFYPNGDIKDVAMGERAFIYIPKPCQNGEKCLFHLNFHGCNEWPPEVAYKYIVNSGFLEVAEANKIVIIFPLTTKVPQNMDGCWDFYSYTGSNFATKEGAQIKVIERIINRILSGDK